MSIKKRIFILYAWVISAFLLVYTISGWHGAAWYFAGIFVSGWIIGYISAVINRS